jgi:ATP:ADP antiporter, AAA family
MTLSQRILSPIVQLRPGEGVTLTLMFAYSFLAMTAYNIVQPITRSRFISALGSENLPYVLLVSVLIIGLLMQGYSRLGSLMPPRWVIPATQAGMVGLLLAFWVLFGTGQTWVEVAFYLFGQIYGILLISQFWTLANLIYDPRAAKRLFGFIGGGASLGGIVGGSITAFLAQQVGNRHLLIVSAAALALCAGVVVHIVRRSRDADLAGLERAAEEEGVGGREALRMLRESKHLQIIAVVIALTSIGAGLIDQQLNMATEAFKGRESTDAMTVVLAQVQVYMSAIGFVIQIWLTSRIHRFLGVGFALLILPVGLGLTSVTILLNAALWAPIFARVLDKSLRYTVDKTSREILFLPLPADLKQKAKPFVDVTVDRFARAMAAVLLLVLIEPWGFGLGVQEWQKISYASLAVMVLWIAMTLVAKRGYLTAFRHSIERQDVRPADVRLGVADLSTIETLVEQLAHPDEPRVLYAIDLLEALDKRHLVSPLLLHHGSAAVRARALGALEAARPEIARMALPAIQRLLVDPDPVVRAAAVGALGTIRNADAAGLVRPLVADPNPRIAATAALVLARGTDADVALAEETLERLTGDTRETAARGRREAAAALRQMTDRRFRPLLVPLLTDPDPEVASEAIRSARDLGTSDFLFVPALVSLLRHRRLKAFAREVLVGYGEEVLGALNHFLRDPDEDVWVRRHLPATIALIPCQRAIDILVAALEEPDGFLRYKLVAALEKLRREHPEFVFRREPIEALALREARRYLTPLSLHYNLFGRGALPADALLARALTEKSVRALDRVYRLLGLLYPWKDIAAARWAIERGDARMRSGALEYLDNILSGALRKHLMLVIEDAPLEEKVRRGNVVLRTRTRDAEQTLLELINDEDQVVSAAAIDLVRERKFWALAPDIEHVLAYRDVREWYVFEAASWALAAYRLPDDDRRRQRWLEPLPSVELASRLRRLPLFASVTVDELFRIAHAGRQVRHEAGHVLFQEGAVPEQMYVLLDGAVTIGAGGAPVHPPAPLGLEEGLEGRPIAAIVRTTEVSVSLVLDREELRRLLADNTDLVQGLFRMLAARAPAGADRMVLQGDPAIAARVPPSGLRPIEKALVLQTVPLFSQVSAAEMLSLSAIVRETPIETGLTLFRESDPPALFILLTGELSLEMPESRTAPHLPGLASAREGDAVGLYETLAGLPMGARGHGLRPGTALRIEHDDLFDLLGQRGDLLQQIFGAFFRAERAPGFVGGAGRALSSG